MRCPKCQYISYDNGERCRNCGYELSLSAAEPPMDVTIGRDQPRAGRIDDIGLTAFDTPLSRTQADAGPDPGELLDTDAGSLHGVAPEDLPLFADRFADDQAPLVTPPAVPRQPLSVRRANPVPRARSRQPSPEELSLDLGARDTASLRRQARPNTEQVEPASLVTAGLVRRFFAGLIDVIVLGVIEASVVYLTLRACELNPDQWRILPLLPLAAFMLLLCGGYFVMFTAAGGQTIGKMTTGIRVVAAPMEDDGILRVSFKAASLRAIACLGSVVLVGAGFLPALFSADRRAFHDRVAETRVVIA